MNNVKETESAMELVDLLYAKGPMTRGEVLENTGWTQSTFNTALTSASFLYDVYEIGNLRNIRYGVNSKARVNVRH